MDYKAIFEDMEKWIQEANQAAARFRMESPEFWVWVADSASKVCQKYNEHRLVIKQMMMLVEWLEEVYEERKSGSATAKAEPKVMKQSTMEI
jgi:hypothetical protein